MFDNLTPQQRDQLFSFGNSILTIVGTVLASVGVFKEQPDLLQMVMGHLAVALSIGMAIWLNMGSVGDQIESVLRKVVLIIGTFATARGWVTAEQVQQWAGPIVGALAMAWSYWKYGKAPSANLPGTTIVDPVSLPAPAPKPAA